MAEKRSPQEIVSILHSISEVRISGDELIAYFDDSPIPNSITGFEMESFTRLLLEFIEDYLLT